MTVKEILNNINIKVGDILYSTSVDCKPHAYKLLYKYKNDGNDGVLAESEKEFIERKEGILINEYVTKTYRVAQFFHADGGMQFFLTEKSAMEEYANSIKNHIRLLQDKEKRIKDKIK